MILGSYKKIRAKNRKMDILEAAQNSQRPKSGCSKF
jgi:hypothetical protein